MPDKVVHGNHQQGREITLFSIEKNLKVMGKRVNRVGGYGLEIPMCYKVMGPENVEKAVT